ncbi:hypothetical protein ACHAXM_003994 [Skeletonema potamos]
MTSQHDDPPPIAAATGGGGRSSSAPAERRRIPKSMRCFLLIVFPVMGNIWYSSKDLLPYMAEFAGGGNSSMAEQVGEHSFMENAMTGQRPRMHLANNNTPNTSRNHSSSSTGITNVDITNGGTACKFCEGDGRIFNPSIRLNPTCAQIRLRAANTRIDNTCKAFRSMENLCCPTGNWSHFWGENNPECFQLNNICHAPNGGKWFYDRSALNSSLNNTTLQQPSIAFNRNGRSDIRIHFNVSSTTVYGGNMTECPYSHTPHHVVSQSAFNHMIGEFYVRQLIGLNKWMRDFPPESDQDIQMYIHIPAKDGSLFDGHRLLMGGLRQNDKVGNFLSLVQGKSSCECYQTLAFCGYSKKPAAQTNKNKSVQYTFDLSASVSHNKAGSKMNWCYGDERKQIDLNCTTYNDLRQDLLARYASKDPLLRQKIREYRHQILSLAGLSLTSSSSEAADVDEWKIVGLTKRQSRRVWLNIDDSVKACDSFRLQKVVCITVNVEEAASPEEQLLMHSSLDALVGIHGAQLTQGIFLPSHGYILELLPWIPDWAWGDWVAKTTSPTPVGVMFHNTDLNHLGYALDRDSVPLCKTVSKTEEIECLQATHRKILFRWDRRDFEVDSNVVSKLVSSFLLQNNTNCDSMKTRATENDFVLYNAYCSSGVGNEFSTEHYYRKANESAS